MNPRDAFIDELLAIAANTTSPDVLRPLFCAAWARGKSEGLEFAMRTTERALLPLAQVS